MLNMGPHGSRPISEVSLSNGAIGILLLFNFGIFLQILLGTSCRK